jgi:hydroxymethylbilane synthase
MKKMMRWMGSRNKMGDACVKIGTRKSRLATWQAEHIGQMLAQRWPDLQYSLELFDTTGDRIPDQPLPEIGGKGLFTQELEDALQRGDIHLVVHSLKDLPVEESPGLAKAAIPPRESAGDVLVSGRGYTLETLPKGARVGTSSLRRSAQLLHRRPDLEIRPLRGNIDTRIRKAYQGEYDAIVLAAAGVNRLGLQAQVTEELSLQVMLPAPGQGALAVQCRSDNAALLSLLQAIDHAETRAAVLAERAFLKGLGGGCSAPVAAYGFVEAGLLHLEGLVASRDGREIIRIRHSMAMAAGEPGQPGFWLAKQALHLGAARFM